MLLYNSKLASNRYHNGIFPKWSGFHRIQWIQRNWRIIRKWIGVMLFSTNSANSFKENYCLLTPCVLSCMKLAALETSLPWQGSPDPFSKVLSAWYMCSIYLPRYVTQDTKLLTHQYRMHTCLSKDYHWCFILGWVFWVNTTIFYNG